MPKLWAVIPAAGSGKRFSATELKQYQIILNRTVLEHTVNTLMQLPLEACVIAIGKQDHFAQSLNFPKQIEFCLGGKERMDSVLAGLASLQDRADDDDYVLVHDAARPCLHPQQIQQILEFCQSGEVAAILAVPVRDTLKKSTPTQKIEKTVNREQLWQAQTPQIVKFKILKKALEQAIQKDLIVTDEASALEHLQIPVHLIAGRADNIKITYPEDLELAQLILQTRS